MFHWGEDGHLCSCNLKNLATHENEPAGLTAPQVIQKKNAPYLFTLRGELSHYIECSLICSSLIFFLSLSSSLCCYFLPSFLFSSASPPVASTPTTRLKFVIGYILWISIKIGCSISNSLINKCRLDVTPFSPGGHFLPSPFPIQSSHSCLNPRQSQRRYLYVSATARMCVEQIMAMFIRML